MNERVVAPSAGAREASTGATDVARTGSPWLMLAMATVGFAVNFWAWALISPLGPLFRDPARSGPSASPTSRCWSPCR